LGDTDGEIGVVADEAIATAEAEAFPPARDADELHDLLLSLYLIEERPEWRADAERLIAAGRATRVITGDRVRLAAAERIPVIAAVLDPLRCEPALPPLPYDVEE